jgi:hypothetical protein
MKTPPIGIEHAINDLNNWNLVDQASAICGCNPVSQSRPTTLAVAGIPLHQPELQLPLSKECRT